MDLEDRPLLHFPDLALALLRASETEAADIDAASRRLAADRRLAREAEPVDARELYASLDRARRHLVAAQFMQMLDETRFRITPRGRAMLHRHPDGIDDSVLMEFAEFRAWVERITRHPPPEDSRNREFQRGWAAAADGCDLGDNPFAPDTAQHAAWEDGWLEANRRGREGA